MSIENVPQEVFDKIQKLLESTNGRTQAEIENINLRVQEILMRWNLSMSDINGRPKKGQKRKFQKGKVDLQGKQGRHDSNWLSSLYNVVARNNFCRAIHINMRRYQYDEGMIVVIGEEVNLEIVMYLVDHLYPKILDSCTYHWKEYGEMSGEKRNTFRRGFLLGCVSGINQKLAEQKQKMEYENNQCTALVRVVTEELNEHISEEFGPLKRGRNNKTRKSEISKGLGFRAGQNMEINKGLGGTTSAGNIDK